MSNGWRKGLEQCVEQGNPFDSELFFDRLQQHYRRTDHNSHQRIARAFGGLLEAWAAKSNGLLAMHNYKKAHEVYRAAGLSIEAKAVRAKIQSATSQSESEMSMLTASIEIPRETMDEFVQSIVGDDWAQSLRRFVACFTHPRSKFENQLNTWLEECPIYGRTRQTVITASGDSVELKSPQEDRESHIIFKAAEFLQLNELFMQVVLDELFVRHDVTPEKLCEITDESPLFPDDRRNLIKRSMNSYCLHDYASFLHLAMPQVEHAIRLLFQFATKQATTTSRDSRRWRTLTLNQILDDPDLIIFLRDDVQLYLRVVLTHDLGLNMRNLICHGLVNQSWYTRGRADRLLHVILLLALSYRRSSTPTQEHPKDDPSGDTERSLM